MQSISHWGLFDLSDLKDAYYDGEPTEYRALVRRLDVALNGELGAAPQASLCDIVGQVEYRNHYSFDGKGILT